MNELKKKLEELNDRIWLKANKKPTGRAASYAGIVTPWVFIGLLLMAIVTLITASVMAPTQFMTLLLPLIFVTGFTVYGVVTSVKMDGKRGYIDAIHRNYLQRREARIAEVKAKLVKSVKS